MGGNMAAVKKKPHWAFDTEDDSRGNTTIINFYNGKTHHTFTARDVRKEHPRWGVKRVTKEVRKRAIEFLLNLESGTLKIWALNLQYDLVNVFADHLEVLEISYVGSRVISARVPGTQVSFFDTLNHWKISAKEMGKRIGLQKIEVDGDFENVDYCRRDTEIVWHFVEKMTEVYEGIDCKLKATIGSTSLRYFQDEFYGKITEQVFKTKELEYMKEGYFGGRTEIFHLFPVKGKIWYFDFNSLYPSVMRENFPILTKDGFHFTKTPNFENEGFVDATFIAPKSISIPYLPFRDPRSGRLLFPLGTFRTRVTFFEARRAVFLGYSIDRIHSALEFTAGSFQPFRDFVEFVYAKRLEAKQHGDSLMSDAFKLLANNLYGKFGQGRDFTKLTPHYGMVKPGDIVLGPLVVRESRGPFPTHTNFIWSGYTTAYGRDKLWRAGDEVIQKNGLLMYMDTDSVIFENDKPIFENSDALGELKLEKPYDSQFPHFGYAHFKLPKLYRMETVEGVSLYRARGVRRDNAREFFETGRASFKRPYKLRETLRRNLNPKRKLKLIPNFWDDIEKQSQKVYDKRVVNSDGSTTPLIIGG